METVLWLLAGGTVLAAWFGAHLAKFNRRKCGRCKGTREHRSWLLFGLFGRYQKCGKCNGTGEVRGWFGRTF